MRALLMLSTTHIGRSMPTYLNPADNACSHRYGVTSNGVTDLQAAAAMNSQRFIHQILRKLEQNGCKGLRIMCFSLAWLFEVNCSRQPWPSFGSVML